MGKKNAQWISTNDMLPPTSEMVLVIMSGNISEYTSLINAVELAEYFEDEGWVCEMYPDAQLKVSYWMPIPEIPEGLVQLMRFEC